MIAVGCVLSIAALLACLNGLATADVITGWNEKGHGRRLRGSGNPRGERPEYCYGHAAMFEALNSIEPRFAPYRARQNLC